jgi:dienelactone hydrolase
MQANIAGADPSSPVVGVVLFASYPAGDLHASLDVPVLSVSGSRDGLATPDKIAASQATLPAGTTFTTIDGGVHAFFGDYGPQPGDGTPTISHDQARTAISLATVDFVNHLSR